MGLAESDVHVAQLALAEGIVELPKLLRAADRAAETGEDLRGALVSSGVVDREEFDRLIADVEQLSGEERRQLVDKGETIAEQTLHRGSQQAAESLARHVNDTVQLHEVPSPSEELGEVESETDDEGASGGRYQILDELGEGGMGQVVRAHDELMNREIALKTVRADASVERPRERLLTEARLTGRLEHPSIVPVYELGQRDDDEPYYTMRVVPDRSLEAILEEIRDGNPEAPSLLNLIQVLRQVCLAIEFAHKNGVVHRDLKPENILVGDYGEVFVIDWGVAKVLADKTDIKGPMTATDHEPGALVGTPRYMAPEQAYGENDAIDERTDVYALGTILYEILTLTPVFSSPSVMGLLVTIVKSEPEPPSQRAPEREIPKPLEEICLRAIAKEPEDRYQTTQELADELDLFIEGAKQREREKEKARQLLEEGHRVRRSHVEARQKLEEAIARRDKLREATPAWAERNDRIELWESEDRVEELRVSVQRKFNEAVRLYGQSLGHFEFDETHDALAGMYWNRFIEVEKRGDREMAAHFENLVRQHDTGAFTEQLRGRANLSVEADGSLSVATDSRGAELRLWSLKEHHRRLVRDEEVASGTEQLECRELPHGRYRLEGRAPGRTPVRMPILLERREERRMQVDFYDRETIPEDFAVIPGGEFLCGPPEEFGIGDDTVELGDYAIQKRPVTCAEYVEFLNDLADDDLEKARRHAPRTGEGADSYFPLVDGKFRIPEQDADGDSWDPEWPICIVNHHDAAAYARWRSERDGRTFRLPTSREWEKAARGVDGRLYPWGDHFDPSFCRMRESTPDKPMPAPVGTHPVDTSPYGVVDMAGNISEWTATEHENSRGTYVLRGGSFNSFPLMCRLDWYLNSPASYRHSHYGFRLVLELGGRPADG